MMSVFDTLAVVRHFLEHQLLPETQPHLRSELRAVLKLLAEVEGEIDTLPALLMADCTDLLDLAEAAEALLDEQPGGKLSTRRWRGEITASASSLRDLIRLHEDISAEAAQILLLLRNRGGDRCDDMARRYVALAGRQAAARLAWQSVFV